MSRTLDLHPAWGFNWEARWEVAASQRDAYIKDRHRDGKCISLSEHQHRLWSEQRMSGNNLAKILAYIPVINVIIGIGRIIFVTNDDTSDPVKKAIIRRHCYRGIADICLGPLLLIVDVIQTIRDRLVVKEYQKQHPSEQTTLTFAHQKA